MSSGEVVPATAPAQNRPASIVEVEVNASYWVYARHRMREVRVVTKARTRVHVAFWTYYGTASQTLVVQPVPYYALRRQRPEPTRQWGFPLTWPAPTVEEIATSVAAIR